MTPSEAEAEVQRLRRALEQIAAYTTVGRTPYDIRWAIANSALNGRDVPDFLPSPYAQRKTHDAT